MVPGGGGVAGPLEGGARGSTTVGVGVAEGRPEGVADLTGGEDVRRTVTSAEVVRVLFGLVQAAKRAHKATTLNCSRRSATGFPPPHELDGEPSFYTLG